MVHEIRTFTVAKAAPAVLAYLADFSHAESWDPGTRGCSRLDDGPVAVGARWQRVTKHAEMEYRITELDAEHVTFAGEAKNASGTDVISVRPDQQGSEITYETTVELHGIAKLGTPVVQYELDLLVDEAVSGIREAVEALPE